MALQDLTPQLRTRLSRMERAVGWFVILATALLLFGFAYYIYNTAERKGWFIKKIYYQTSIASGAGLKEGDPVKLMGFDVGEITRIQANDPYDYYNITVDFRIKVPNQGYLWSDSTARVAAGDLLGHRYLEVTKGKDGIPTVLESTNRVLLGMLKWKYLRQREAVLSKQFTNRNEVLQGIKAEVQKNPHQFYTNVIGAQTAYWLEPEESPAVTERLERVVNQVEAALPSILSLTNQLAIVLSNTASMTANFSEVAARARPAISNLTAATENLGKPGGLGEWLLPTNINQKLDSLLGGADATVANANTNLAVILENLNRSLLNLADMTSNLNQQVQMNTNILSQISRAVIDADDLVQGLKRHWFLRSAFKSERTNAPAKPGERVRSPKDRGGG